jgi:hypothetical protein
MKNKTLKNGKENIFSTTVVVSLPGNYEKQLKRYINRHHDGREEIPLVEYCSLAHQKAHSNLFKSRVENS